MNRIDTHFKQKNNNLSIYFTAGYPVKNSVLQTIKLLAQNGADIIEIGIPFSDPLADGPIIQESGKIALENGITLKNIFEQIAEVRTQTQVPLVMMGYLNTVLQFGVEKFLETAKKCGIDGVILPDLPPDEYEIKYKTLFENAGVYPIFLITPQTSNQRLAYIDSISKGFIYAVSSSSTTGSSSGFNDENIAYFKRISEMNLKNPIMIGFGISSKESLQTVFKYAKGAIVGSAFIKNIKTTEKDFGIQQFIKNLTT